ncbi:putative Cys-rich domain containing protein [Histomonas meleagridis]|uniref:putative Cys-rich domain containing protein n=1 Tax=Histomonas meleagridis TaxID=135588 RepID=UPI00355A7FE1|nr:putative Cys-rich domain containing protein [Histomonas meleagridis]KAH0797873.1 putative Cys-rich domain containing protein [Histomonas meleagridis]
MQDYSGGTFGCFKDIKICLYGCFCAACLNGENHSKIRSEDCTICHCIEPIAPYWIRKGVLSKKGKDTNDNCADCLITCFCAPCVICQDARELNGE